MKKNIFYMLMGGLLLSLAACSENWEDATSKHAYGENENPYLRADAKATVIEKIKFGAGQTYTVDLTKFAEVFQTQLGMTIDETIAGMSSGKVVFCNINAPRNTWDKTVPNKGTSGWFFDAMGSVTTQASAKYSLELNSGNKSLLVNALESAIIGSSVSLNVGFAINGSDYDKYVRIVNEVVIVDVPVEVSIQIPDGEYSSTSIDFKDYASAIQERFGLTVTEFCAQLDGSSKGTIHMYSVDVESLKWDETSSYTANPPGYWMEKNGKVTNWGSSGYALYAECSVEDEVINIGRSSKPIAGDKYTISLGFRDKTDVTKLLRFVISITME